MKKKSKSQVSMEFMMVLGFVLIMVAPMIAIYYSYTNDTEFELSQNQALKIAHSLIDNAESVYYQGEPSKKTIKVLMPDGVDSVNINNKEIVFKMYHNKNLMDIVAVSNVNLTGNISVSKGIKYITVKSLGDVVEISNG